MTAPTKILLVDDVPQNLIALDALLRHTGVTCLHADSGAQALELLLQHDVGLALVDVQMPDMDGFELAELMRGSARTSHVPLIFLTATDRDTARMFKGYEAGAVDFLYKPFDPSVLRSKVHIFVQLHEQKRQLAEQVETMRQMVRTIEMFVAVLGHDLRNPLSSIMASADLLMLAKARGQGTVDPERIDLVTNRIQTSGKRMARMIEQLLDVARLRSGQLVVRPVITDLASLCPAILSEFDAVHPDRSLALRVEGNVTGRWDPDRLSQVLSNLIGNAMHHGEPGTPVNVDVGATPSGGVRIAVNNRGAVAEEIKSDLFKPFRASVSATHTDALHGAGLGLGLYIAHELVRLHGGSLTLQSSEETGTTFEILLPQAHQGTNATLPRHDEGRLSASVPPPQGFRTVPPGPL